MNRSFLINQPVSESNLWCTTCGHVYDPLFRICTCMSAESYKEYGTEDANQPIRRVIPFKQYIKEKYADK